MLQPHYCRRRSGLKIRYQEIWRTCSPPPRNGSHMSAPNMCLSGHIFLQRPHHMMYDGRRRFARRRGRVCWWVRNGAWACWGDCLGPVFNAQVVSHGREMDRADVWMTAKRLMVREIRQFTAPTSGFAVNHGDGMVGWMAVFFRLVSEGCSAGVFGYMPPFTFIQQGALPVGCCGTFS